MLNKDNNKYYDLKYEKPKKHKHWIIYTLVGLLLLAGLAGGIYTFASIRPVNPQDKTTQEVRIKYGTSKQEIADMLEQKGLIRSNWIFYLWLRLFSRGDLKAGVFYLSPAMNNQQIIKTLEGPGIRPIVGHVLIKEGQTIDEIADTVAKHTTFSRQDFLQLMTNQAFLAQLAKHYPTLLSASMKQPDVRYHLEGYLYPAKYNVYKGASLKSLVKQMINKETNVLGSYYQAIKQKGLTVHQALTLASLVEGEGVTKTDRRKIAGVFFNRLAADMPLQSDISVMYALNKHKRSLTLADVQVNSPYNLYVNKGYGPGPCDNPSLESVLAILHPKDRDRGYLYFVADLKTGKIYYSTTYDEHLKKSSNLGE